jgi:hypothetical protein
MEHLVKQQQQQVLVAIPNMPQIVCTRVWT